MWNDEKTDVRRKADVRDWRQTGPSNAEEASRSNIEHHILLVCAVEAQTSNRSYFEYSLAYRWMSHSCIQQHIVIKHPQIHITSYITIHKPDAHLCIINVVGYILHLSYVSNRKRRWISSIMLQCSFFILHLVCVLFCSVYIFVTLYAALRWGRKPLQRYLSSILLYEHTHSLRAFTRIL